MLTAKLLGKGSSGIFSGQGWDLEIEPHAKAKPKTYTIALIGPESPIFHLVIVLIVVDIAVILLVAVLWQLSMLGWR
jgi:hypothetical protein